MKDDGLNRKPRLAAWRDLRLGGQPLQSERDF